MKKDKGVIENLVGMLPLAVLLVFSMAFIQLSVHEAASDYIEDALAASNLASAVIDTEVYGRTGGFCVRDPSGSYRLYQDMLKINLKLDENWACKNPGLIAGTVTVYEYILYEVDGNDVTEYSFSRSGVRRKVYPGGLGEVAAPDGTVIGSLSVYSRIGFPIETLGKTAYCYKEKCVDVVRN